MAGKYILVNDVGTTGTRSIIYDEETNVVAESYTELEQIFPKPGWTEQDPVAIFDRCVEVTHKSLDSAGLKASDIAAMGIATQRATSMLWDADTGEPVYNAITWQDTRMSDECERVNKSGTFKMLHVVGGGYQRIAPLSKTLKKNPVGKMLIAAAHFTVTPAMSSAHARWTLDNIEGAKEKAAAGKLLFGTVDAWLVWKYTGGRVHATDFSNVSATGMFDPFGMKWSSQLLKPFGLPGGLKFPEIRETGGDFGETDLFGAPIPIKSGGAVRRGMLRGRQRQVHQRHRNFRRHEHRRRGHRLHPQADPAGRLEDGRQDHLHARRDNLQRRGLGAVPAGQPQDDKGSGRVRGAGPVCR